MKQTTYYYLLALSFTLFIGLTANAQSVNTQYGKNRVQFHKFDWFEYETDNFRVFWHGDSRNIGQAAIQIAEWDYPEIQKILEHRINRRIEIVVYSDLTDFKQSNIGNEESFVNIGGKTKIVENKIYIYFNGDHRDLRRQVREGIANVYINNMMFGTNLQEVVQNAVLLNLPEWYTSGLAAYVGEKWNSDLDNQLKDVLASGDYNSFETLAAAYPKLAGHSLWYYIDNNYGGATASNLIYLTRINRSIESGFLYVLGSPYGRTLLNWKEYFNERYAEGKPVLPADSLRIAFRNKRELPVSRACISPDGKRIAYLTNEEGLQKVYVQNLADGKRKMIFKNGFRNAVQSTDYDYPLLAWAPDNRKLGILYEKRDVVKFLQYNTDDNSKEEQNFAPQYQRVHSMEYMDANTLLLSASIRGLSDIFTYRIIQRSTNRITNDFYDDRDAVPVNLGGMQGILFASNRGNDSLIMDRKLDTIIPFGTYDIYYYPLSGNDDKTLVRITDTPYSNERFPLAMDDTNYAFLSDENGTYNRFIGELEDYLAYREKVVLFKDGTEIILPPDSIPDFPKEQMDSIYVRPIIKQRGHNFPATNYGRGIAEAYASARNGKVVENIYHNGSPTLYIMDMDASVVATHSDSPYRQQLLKEERQKQEEAKRQEERKPTKKADNKKSGKPATWEFDPGFGAVPPNPEAKDSIPDKIDKTLEEREKEFGYVFITDYLETDESSVVAKPMGTQPAVPARDTGKIDIDNYQFESDFNTTVPDAAVIVEDDDGRITLQSPSISHAKGAYGIPARKTHRFRPAKVLAHRLKFKSKSVTTQLDNSLLFGGLEVYTGSPYNYPPLGLLLESSVHDLFEDYELKGGIRIPTSFDGLEYYVTFKDKKKRLDKYYSYYRKTHNERFEFSPIPYNLRSAQDLAQVELRYPLDIFGSLRAKVTARNDKVRFLGNDRATLESEPLINQLVGLRLEYVFDNVIEMDVNLKHGTLFKAYVEVNKRMDVDLFNGFQWNFNKGAMGLIGTDLRHYIRLGKHAVFASRFTAATSFGSEKMLYFIGGTENDIFPNFNENIPLPDPATSDFAYQTLASPIRGFNTNIRNGNTFVLGNAEIRVPIFKYFYKRPIKSNFIRNFQVVGFFDVGTAWQGLSPFSKDNPLNTDVITTPPGVISVTVNYYRDPVVSGFGGGIRTKLFGYFIRLDYAKGIETKRIQPGMWHVSLGTDF